MNTEGKVGWEEIVDSHLDGNFDMQELNDMAALAYKCVNRVPKKRPSMRDIVQILSRIPKTKHSKKHHRQSLSSTANDITIDIVDQPESHTPISEHKREESMDSTLDIEL